jgi:beta-phosphoglucomutase-like phosphatase (HAD superfamily)
VKPALLFDLDGTLVDSDGDHLAAFQEVFAPFGITLDRALYTAEIMGASNAAIGARFLPQLSVSEREQVLDAKEAAYRARVGAMVATRGAVALLDYAQARGLPCAVVTNAPRANAEQALTALALSERFHTRAASLTLCRI